MPQASGQLAALWQRAAAVEEFDRAFYGDDGASRQQFVERLYAENPAALRAMFSAAEQILIARRCARRATANRAHEPLARRSSKPIRRRALNKNRVQSRSLRGI